MTANIQCFVNKLCKVSGFQVLMTCLNSLTEYVSFIWDGILSHNLNLCLTNFLIHNWPFWHDAYIWVIPHIVLYFLSYRKSFRKNNWPLNTLNNSTVSVLRFLWGIETDQSFSKRSLKDDFLSLWIKRRHLSWRRFMLLLLVRLWHIQKSWQ